MIRTKLIHQLKNIGFNFNKVMSQGFPRAQPTWSDVLRLHDEMQNSKEVLEKNLDRERRAKSASYQVISVSEWLDSLLSEIVSQYVERTNQPDMNDYVRNAHKLFREGANFLLIELSALPLLFNEEHSKGVLLNFIWEEAPSFNLKILNYFFFSF